MNIFSFEEASEDSVYFGVCIFDSIRLDNEWPVWGIHLIGILVPACILSDTRHYSDELVDMDDEFSFVCDFHKLEEKICGSGCRESRGA